jgi:integrase
MPIKLIAPRKGKSPNWTMRGTHLRVYVDESCRTYKRSVARKVRDEREAAIERGEWPPKQTLPRAELDTFIGAAINYMETGHRRRYVGRLIKYFGEIPLTEIDQGAIDQAAITLHPNVTAATRNTCVYTPVSAIMRHAGRKIDLKRPKGAKGRVITDALSPDDAFAIIRAAESFDPEYALLLQFLLYTGCRLGEALALRWEDCRLTERTARVRTSKNGDPRELVLREDLCAALQARAEATGRVFRFRQGGHLKHMLTRARLAVLGIACPARRPTGWRQPPHRLSWVNHHSFCHTWATWMRRYGGLDDIGLAATNRWRDPRSARRYAHAVAREEWQKVEALPGVENPWKKASGDDK